MRAMQILLPMVPLLLASALARGDGTLKEMTFPRRPQRDALDRLGLTLAWHVKVPTERARDGIFHVQVIPGPRHPQLLLQTFAGAVMLVDGETGDLLWRVQPGPPYWTLQPPSYNSHSIFTTARNLLYVLDRATGEDRYHEVVPGTKVIRYGFRIESLPSAGSVADEDALYFVMGDRVVVYDLPEYGAGDKLKEAPRKAPGPPGAPATGNYGPGESGATGAKGEPAVDISAPTFRWSSIFATLRFRHRPLVTIERLGLVSNDGTFLSVNKFERGQELDFKAQGAVEAAPGQHVNIAYVGARDSALYAIDIPRGILHWRFLGGGPILQKPYVNDDRVYFFATRMGMYSLDRLSGRELWRHPTSEEFLAANPRFVYTRNRAGTLMVLDGTRGTSLAHYDFQDWKVPVPNEITDRIYLANHDGQILCLHHRNHPTPLKMKAVDLRIKREEKNEDKKEEKKENAGAEKKEEANLGTSSFPSLTGASTAPLAERRRRESCKTNPRLPLIPKMTSV